MFKPHTSIEEISAYVHEVEKAGTSQRSGNVLRDAAS